MRDEEKFAAFKRSMIDENERRYGAEARKLYSDRAVDEVNAKLAAMTPEQYGQTDALSKQVNEAIRAAFEAGDPKGELARRACALHKEWLLRYWSHYSPEAHCSLAQTHVDDPRFRAYYDALVHSFCAMRSWHTAGSESGYTKNRVQNPVLCIYAGGIRAQRQTSFSRGMYIIKRERTLAATSTK